MSSKAFGFEDVRENFIFGCCISSVFSLLFFEYLITLSREFQLVWKRKFNVVTIFFLVNRYVSLLQPIIDLRTINPLTKESCTTLAWLTVILDIIPGVVLAVFLSLQVYALSGRRWTSALSIFILSLSPFGFSIYALMWQVPTEAPPPINCTFVVTISPKTETMFVILFLLILVARPATIVVDAIVLAVTVLQTYGTGDISRKVSHRRSFSALVLRNETLYFIAITSINIIDIVMNVTQHITVMTPFSKSITAILFSRLLLDLSELKTVENDSVDCDESVLPFTTIIDLSPSLCHGLSFCAQERGDFDEKPQLLHGLCDRCGVRPNEAKVHGKCGARAEGIFVPHELQSSV